jgi:hypothetical protein
MIYIKPYKIFESSLKPYFDKTPNDKIGDKKIRVISKNELEEFIQYVMSEPIEYFSGPISKRKYDSNNKEIPDEIEYLNYENSIPTALYYMTGLWMDDPKDFLKGKSIRGFKDDISYAMEGYEKYFKD